MKQMKQIKTLVVLIIVNNWFILRMQCDSESKQLNQLQ